MPKICRWAERVSLKSIRIFFHANCCHHPVGHLWRHCFPRQCHYCQNCNYPINNFVNVWICWAERSNYSVSDCGAFWHRDCSDHWPRWLFGTIFNLVTNAKYFGNLAYKRAIFTWGWKCQQRISTARTSIAKFCTQRDLTKCCMFSRLLAWIIANLRCISATLQHPPIWWQVAYFRTHFCLVI